MRRLRVRRSDATFIANGVVLVVAIVVMLTIGNWPAACFAGVALMQTGLAAMWRRGNDDWRAAAHRSQDIADRATWGRHLS